MLLVGYFEDIDSQRGIDWPCTDGCSACGPNVSSEVSRTCATTGGAHRSWLRGPESVTKRYRIAAAAHNLSIMMRRLFSIGKPRVLQGYALPHELAHLVVNHFVTLFTPSRRALVPPPLRQAA